MKNFALFFILLCNPIFAQISTSQVRGFEPNNDGEAKINRILANVGKSFTEGLLSLQDNRRGIARGKFDEAVEVFLMSNINVKINTKLNNCYNQMIETIYRIEFPSVQQPQIQSLALTCGWNIDNQLANSVVKISQTKPSETTTASTETNSTNISQLNTQQVGFTDQTFDFQGDELAKLDFLKEPSQRKRTITTNSNKNDANNLKANSETKLVRNLENSNFTGNKPTPTKSGQYSLVTKYIYDNFHDPYTVKYVTWSEPIQVEYGGTKFWRIAVKLRAKNLFNAYRLTVVYFFIKQDKVVFSLDQSDEVLSDVKELSYQKQNITVQKPLVIKGLLTVTVKAGDTITKIAARFGVSALEIARLNGLPSIDVTLSVGRQIRIQVK